MFVCLLEKKNDWNGYPLMELQQLVDQLFSLSPEKLFDESLIISNNNK